MGTGVVKRRPEEQICPVCACTAPELQTFFHLFTCLAKYEGKVTFQNIKVV